MAVRKYDYSDAVLYSKINILCHCYYDDEELLSLHGILPINIEELQAKNEEFFIAVDLISINNKEAKVHTASGINRQQLDELYSGQYKTQCELIFDNKLNSFFIEKTTCLWEMPVEKAKRQPANAEEIKDLLPQLVFEKWEEFLEIGRASCRERV